jgi:outer membrane protein assembly factor BamB
MKRISIVVLILCGCLLPGGAWSQPLTCKLPTSWSEFHRKNMHRQNPCEAVLNVHNVGKLTLKWGYAAGNYVDSSPAVATGVVYVGSEDSNVYALNASSGAKLWSYATSMGGVHSSPAVANGVVYVGSEDSDVYALNAKTGAKLWAFRTGYFV